MKTSTILLNCLRGPLLDAFCHAWYLQDHFTEFLHCRSTSSLAWSTAETSLQAYCAWILLQSRAHSHSSHCAICSGVVMAKKVPRTDCWDTLQGRVCWLHFEWFSGTFWGLQSMATHQVRTRCHQDGCTGLGIPHFLALASCCRPISFGFFVPCVAASHITGSPVAVLMALTVMSHTPSIATINILTVFILGYANPQTGQPHNSVSGWTRNSLSPNDTTGLNCFLIPSSISPPIPWKQAKQPITDNTFNAGEYRHILPMHHPMRCSPSPWLHRGSADLTTNALKKS